MNIIQTSFWHATIKMSITTPPDSLPFSLSFITVPLGFSVCYNLQRLSSTALCTNSSTPSSLRWAARLLQTLFLLTWSGGAERKQSSRMGSVWLTSKGRTMLSGCSPPLHFNLQPAGKHLSKTQAIHPIQTAASSISHTTKYQRNQPMGGSWHTNSCCVDIQCVHIVPPVKCCQLKQSGGCRADSVCGMLNIAKIDFKKAFSHYIWPHYC